MEICAEFHWLSYKMTSKKWVEAMDEYNHQLAQKIGTVSVGKNPLTLFHKLDKMKRKLIKRVLKDNFKCTSHSFTLTHSFAPTYQHSLAKQNTEAFWQHHYFILNLIKGNSATAKKVSALYHLYSLFLLSTVYIYPLALKSPYMLLLQDNYIFWSREVSHKLQMWYLC